MPSERTGGLKRLMISAALSLLLLTAPCEQLAAQTVNNDRNAADQLIEDGYRLAQEGSKESLARALSKFEQALSISRAANDGDRTLLALMGVGTILSAMGEERKAVEYFVQALPLLHKTGDSEHEAAVLLNVAKIYSGLGERDRAGDYYERALPLLDAAGDGADEASTLNSLGQLYSARGARQKALEYFSRALPLYRAAGDRKGEAAALANIAGEYSGMGEWRKALDFYEQATAAARAAGDKFGEAFAQTGAGKVYSESGEQRKAIDIFTRTLPVARAAGDREGEAILLNNIGGNYAALGEGQKALDNYLQALSLSHSAGLREDEATTLNNLGLLYSELGEPQKALDYYAQALPLWRVTGDRLDEATTLNNIGVIQSDSGESREAIKYFEQALAARRAAGDPLGEAVALSNLGSAYNSIGDKAKAAEYNLRALPVFHDAGDRRSEAQLLTNIGVMYAESGEREKALDFYDRALPLRHAAGDRRGEALTLYNVARLERDRGRLPEARARAEEAINILESLRSKIADSQLRSSYFASVQDYYELYIDILMRLDRQSPGTGFDGLALRAVERSRARVLLETLAEAGADIRQGVDPALLERERSAQLRLDAAARRQIEMTAGGGEQEKAATVAAEIAAVTSELAQVETEIRRTSPRYAALTQPQPLSASEIQTQLLDPDTLLLEYSLGEERSYLFAVTKDSIKSYELPPRAEIEAAARQAYALLSDAAKWGESASRAVQRGLNINPESGTTNGSAAAATLTPRALSDLSRMVLAPVSALLAGKRLAVVADGALQYIPFAALDVSTVSPAPAASYHPLILDHEIVSLPSASTLAVLRGEVKDRRPAPKTLAVLADPVFDDSDARVRVQNRKAGTETAQAGERGIILAAEQLKTAAQDSGVVEGRLMIPPLPGTRLEAEQIVRLVPAGESREALGFQASRETAADAELAGYRYVHFATHGFLNSRHPELSGLVLSMVDELGRPRDGFLRAHEVFNLRLPAEMVVLSACETGLGKEIRGEGLIGLTRGFMYAGAPRVVVSLWSVSDASTAELMTRFYEGVIVKHSSPASALRAAQVSLIEGGKYAAPFYWAAFTLQGEWR